MLSNLRRVVHLFVCLSLLLLVSETSPRLLGQSGPAAKLTPRTGSAVRFALSTAVRDLLPDEAPFKPGDPDANSKSVPNRLMRPNTEVESVWVDGALHAPDVQPGIAGLESPGSATTPFDGLSNQDNFNAFGFRVTPSDANGDVGPNHYVEQVNILVRVWDKNGAALSAPFKLSTLFAPLGGICANLDNGDPVVLYDQLADRWVLSQFGYFASTIPPYFQCIAISQTPDPTGAYFLYAFLTSTTEWGDYPKLGVWPDGYYMMNHQFTGGVTANGTGMYAFDRVKMLAGDPTASFIYFNLSVASFPEIIFGGLPADLDGLNPPPAGAPNIFALLTSPQFGDPAFGVRLFNFHADFANPANSTFTERPESTQAAPIPVAPFSVTNPIGRRDIPQPSATLVGNAPVTQALDSISGFLMNRLQYRNLGTHESLVVTHTVGAPGSTVYGVYRAAPRTYELRNTGTGYFVHEQSTFAPGGEPGDGVSRWMASAATDNQGNLAVGYTASSGQAGGNVFPSLRYAGRLASDPPGGMFQGERVLFTGSGAQTSTLNRWGDYSSLMVDPADDCTFWYTGQYYTAASAATSTFGWLTGVGTFKFSECTAPAKGKARFLVSSCTSSVPVANASIAIGGMPYGATVANGTYEATLPPGTYAFSASRPPTYGTTAGTFDVVNGATTDIPVCLAPVAFVTVAKQADAAIVAAGETIGFTVTLTNHGEVTAHGLAFTDNLPAASGVNWSIGAGTDSGWSIAGAPPTQSLVFSETTLAGSAVTHAHVISTTTSAGKHTNKASFTSADAGSGSATADVSVVSAQCDVNEGFEDVRTLVPAGWFMRNNSQPGPGPTGWFQGNPATFAAHEGGTDSYIAADFQNGIGLSTLSNWLLTPMLTFKNGSQLTFWTRRVGSGLAAFPDRLQVRMSTKGTSVDVGTTATSVGDFDVLLLDINPTYSTATTYPSGYPAAFTQFTVTVSGLSAPTTGRLAFRYFVENGGPSGANSNFIGIDTLSYGCGAVRVSKKADAPTASPGSTIGFTVRLTNSDTVAATNLSFSDLLPAGFSINWSLDPATTNPGWSLSGLPPNQSLVYSPTTLAGNTITTAHVISPTTGQSCGVHLNTASISSSVDSGSASASVRFVRPVLFERFDSIAVPALPSGWTATQGASVGVFPRWVTSSFGIPAPSADSPPNSAFSVDPTNILDNRLDSTPFAISERATLTFRHRGSLENTFDGGVLEISSDGGPFQDILSAGGTFVTGGYNGTINKLSGNPIAGRQAWTGNIGSSASYVTVIVNLPESAIGKTLVLRWRMGSDESASGQGWRIDNVSVEESVTCPKYVFTGFFAPISNTALNNIAAGLIVPVKFSLGGDQGLGILGAMSPRSQQIDCATRKPIGPVSATSSPSGLTYDPAAGQYVYPWKTEMSWKGTCRALHVELLDQTTHSAAFRFK